MSLGPKSTEAPVPLVVPIFCACFLKTAGWEPFPLYSQQTSNHNAFVVQAISLLRDKQPATSGRTLWNSTEALSNKPVIPCVLCWAAFPPHFHAPSSAHSDSYAVYIFLGHAYQEGGDKLQHSMSSTYPAALTDNFEVLQVALLAVLNLSTSDVWCCFR